MKMEKKKELLAFKISSRQTNVFRFDRYPSFRSSNHPRLVINYNI